MSRKYALIIGNTEYIDPGLAQLTAPSKDTEDFARVLRDKDICAFDDVSILLNQLSSSAIEAVDMFFDQRKPDDLLVLYFSGHGVRDESGSLYLAVRNTIRTRLRSTAIKADYLREAMDQSRSKRQVVFLDCCNSGAFPQGTKAEIGGLMGMTQAFQGYGRFVLTASDATQFAWEGDRVIGETDNSLFTHFLVKGLEGEADSDSDGRITVDELYDYTYEQISKVTPNQTPTKSATKQEGEIVLRHITRIEDIKPVALPAELMDEVQDPRPYVREAAVQKLERLLKGRNLGLARSAREALEKIIEDENTTRRVAMAATQALESMQQPEQKAPEDQKAGTEATHKEIPQETIYEAKPEPVKMASGERTKQTRQIFSVQTGRPGGFFRLYDRRIFLSAMILVTFVLSFIFAPGLLARFSTTSSNTSVPTPSSFPILISGKATNSPIATLTHTTTATPSRTKRPTLEPTLTAGAEYFIYVAVSRVNLYKGPGLAYGVVNQKPYPRGEKFTVMARNWSGVWFLARASDGVEGWLYIDWIDSEFDLSIIPTASYTPPAPSTPDSTKPEGPGSDGPPPCNPC